GGRGVNKEDRFGLAALVAHQGPARVDRDLAAVLAKVGKLASPTAFPEQLLVRLLEMCSVGINEIDHPLAADFLRRPPVNPFRSLVPGANCSVEIAHGDGVRSEI